MTFENKKRILITFPDRKTFLETYQEDSPTRGFYVAGHPSLDRGDEIDLELFFMSEVMVFNASGVVQSRYSTPTGDPEGGFRVALKSREQNQTSKLILDFVHGRLPRDLRRRARRFPIQIEVEYTADNHFAHELTANISRRGAFILTENVLDAGTLLALRLKPPNQARTIELTAEVVRRQTGALTGMGVEFVTGNPVIRRELNAIVDRVAANLGVPKIPALDEE